METLILAFEPVTLPLIRSPGYPCVPASYSWVGVPTLILNSSKDSQALMIASL